LGAVVVVGAVVYALLPQPVGVDAATIERGLLRVTVDEDGQTRIRERYVVSSPLSGRLLRIDLEPGDEVKAGDTLIARIEPTAPDLLDPRARAQAQARLNGAEARLQQVGPELQKALVAMQYAETELARERGLLERNATSRLNLEEKELLFRTRTAEYNAAKFAEEIARFEKELAEAALLRTQPEGETIAEDWYFEIKAPIDGRVLRVIQESATVVTPGTSLVELGDPSDLEVIVDVLSHDAVKVLPGAKAFLEHWGGERPLIGTVRLVEPSGFTKISALGVEEQRVWVIVDFDDPKEGRVTLGDGFRVEARIVIWEEPDVLKVPVGALFRSGADWAVFVIKDGRVEQRPVKVGQRSGLEAQILEGVSEGDVVVVHPSDQVVPGVKVYRRNGETNGEVGDMGET
jgi:HlyD family secretion protein